MRKPLPAMDRGFCIFKLQLTLWMSKRLHRRQSRNEEARAGRVNCVRKKARRGGLWAVVVQRLYHGHD